MRWVVVFEGDACSTVSTRTRPYSHHLTPNGLARVGK